MSIGCRRDEGTRASRNSYQLARVSVAGEGVGEVPNPYVFELGSDFGLGLLHCPAWH